jgi:TPR repeat protein
MTTPKAKLAGLVLIAALCAGFTLGLTAPAWAGWDEATAAYKRGDYATTIRELRPLAEQGNAKAQSNLGFMYIKGQGVPQDDAEAVKWYRRAAEQGVAQAQYTLGFMYSKGRAVPLDDAKALQWYRKAAEQGYAGAQLNLGVMYSNGEGVPQDYAKAHMWFHIVASRLPPAENRDIAVKNRDIVAERMTPAQISEAQKLAREWKPK